jgi:CarD family transcriptional regulator
MTYENGDKVVVPGCGVGSVRDIARLQIGGQDIDTLEIGLKSQDGRVWIPLSRLDEHGIRPVMPKSRIAEVLSIIAEQEAPKRRSHWNQRRRRYTEMLDSCLPESIAALIGELSAVRARKDKGLSFTEKRMLRRAWRLLSAEVAATRGVPREQVVEEIAQIVAPPTQV